MGVAATLVMWSRPREQTFVSASNWGSMWNLVSIGLPILAKKLFENGGRTDGRRTPDDGPWLYYKLTNGSGELKISIQWRYSVQNSLIAVISITVTTMVSCYEIHLHNISINIDFWYKNTDESIFECIFCWICLWILTWQNKHTEDP